MNLLDIISAPIHAVSVKDPLSHARNVMLKKDISRVLVTNEKDELVGVLTKTDITKRLQQNEPKWKRRPIDRIPVSRIMTENVVKADSSSDISEIAQLMIKNKISGIPIIEDGTANITEKGDPIGIVTKLDLVKYHSETVDDRKVSDIYTDEVIAVHQYHTLNRVIEKMERNGIHRIIVENDDGSPTGIVTNSDITFAHLNKPHEKGLAGNDLKMVRKNSKGGRKEKRIIKKNMVVAKDIMSSPLIKMEKNQKASVVAKTMINEGISGIPITSEDELVGIITKTDFVEDLC
ncbi:CBS domain-containing protein [archaeon SCG-AAA382B04]|nr:CBS domain-containing protein [archaeon SCG-AAA382B04]